MEDFLHDLANHKIRNRTIAFLRVATQELLSHTDAQNGLSERTDHIVKLVSLQVFHRSTRFSLAGKEHTVGLCQLLRIVCQQRFYA